MFAIMTGFPCRFLVCLLHLRLPWPLDATTTEDFASTLLTSNECLR